MNTGGVFIQTNQISHVLGGVQKLLQNGRQVLVRVISDKGNGVYEGSVAGVRVNIHSSKTMKPGQTFLASITSKNGTVLITPKSESPAPQEQLNTSKLQNEHLKAILSQLGLPTDKLSEHLFLQFKQLGLKLDSQLLQKLRNFSLRFKGKQKEVAELLAILKEKGIDATQEDILKLLSELDLDERQSESNSENQQKQSNKEKTFEKVNQINSVKGKWYFLPFEITEKESVEGVGNIKLFYEDETHLKYLNVECLYSNKRFLFNLEFENKVCKRIRFNISEKKSEINSDNQEKEKVQSLTQKLKNAGISEDKTIVEWVQSELIEGTACELETVQTVRGSV